MCLFNKDHIAFVRHTALIEFQMRDPSFPIDQFQLLCTNGQRVQGPPPSKKVNFRQKNRN